MVGAVEAEDDDLSTRTGGGTGRRASGREGKDEKHEGESRAGRAARLSGLDEHAEF